MQVDVIPNVTEARSDDFVQKTVIVVDVLRATSTIVTALAHGCAGIAPVETVQQAKQMREPGILLGGERFGKKISGFDLGNSPLEYNEEAVCGKSVVLTTTNGTRAIQKAQRASFVLAACMLNAAACARKSLELNRDIVILCAGTQDHFSLEDGLCAGLLVDELYRNCNDLEEVNDFGKAMRWAYLAAEHRIREELMESSGGKKLIRLGFGEDVLYCAQINEYELVPVLKDQWMIRF